MKRITAIILYCIAIANLHAQNGVWGPAGVYGPQHNAATLIGDGGHILIGNEGNWFMNGNITSADKGNTNAPNATGRSETITFSGSGNYSNATTTVASVGNATNGYIIDGYAGTDNIATNFTLPLGNATAAYPVTVPAGALVTAAYFDGNGSTQNLPVNNALPSATTEYSPYIDMPGGIAAGTYTFSYPSGFTAGNNALLESGNTSAAGTGGTTSYNLLADVADFSIVASTTTAAVAATPATQVYFSSSLLPLPISLTSFTGRSEGCNALLNWTVANDVDIQYYNLESSFTGEKFKVIARIAAKRSNTPVAYTYRVPYSENTLALYRLNMVADNGKSEYSTVEPITVNGCLGGGTEIYPNPVNNELIHIKGLTKGSRISILNQLGQQMTSFVAEGDYQTVDINSYADGLYMFEIKLPDGRVNNYKVVKQ